MENRRGFFKYAGMALGATTILAVPWEAPEAAPEMEACVPEQWAKEAQKILQENMVTSRLY